MAATFGIIPNWLIEFSKAAAPETAQPEIGTLLALRRGIRNRYSWDGNAIGWPIDCTLLQTAGGHRAFGLTTVPEFPMDF